MDAVQKQPEDPNVSGQVHTSGLRHDTKIRKKKEANKVNKNGNMEDDDIEDWDARDPGYLILTEIQADEDGGGIPSICFYELESDDKNMFNDLETTPTGQKDKK